MSSPCDKNVGILPKSPTLTEDVSEQASTSEFSITNPFESHHNIDSLLQPSFSPSVFQMNASAENDVQKTPNSFWSIDQIAVLKPMDIDLSTLHNQQDFVRLDPACERRAQQAIDEFFASHIEMPSPWSAERPNNSHYLALISPSPAQMKKKVQMTPRTGKPGCSSSSAASSISSSSQIRVRKFLLNNGKNAQSCGKKTKDDEVFLEKNEKISESKNASTQTTLTLPKNFDLEAILGQYFTHEEKAENTNETLNNTSLRRKLFFPDGRELDARNKHGEINVNMLQHIDDLNDLEKFDESPVPLQKIKPSNNNITPLTHSMYGEIPRTPSTCQSHYSSSPLMSGAGFDARTPHSTNSQRPRFGSGIRRRKMLLGSSEDEELMKLQMDELESPELSPVKAATATESAPTQDLNNASIVDDASMSFRVTEDKCDTKAVPKERNYHLHPLGDPPPAMESSRRQLLLDSPPLSPITPIKRSHDKKSSSINQQINSSQSLAVSNQVRTLCPSPMLSPIPGKHNSKPTKVDNLKIKKEGTSLLSSTATRLTVPVSFNFEKNNSDFLPSSGAKSVKESKNIDADFSVHKLDVESNKENIFPSPAVCSSMLLHESDDSESSLMNETNDTDDVSMILDQTSCNQDNYMQFEKHSTSVLHCSQAVNTSNPVLTGNNQIQPCEQGSSHKLLPDSGTNNTSHPCLKIQNNNLCMDISPRKSGNFAVSESGHGAMDVSMSHTQCHAFDDTTNSHHPTEYQGDSGYSTTQSNYQAV